MSYAALQKKPRKNANEKSEQEGAGAQHAPVSTSGSAGPSTAPPGIQRKVKVSEPGDAAEHEAERMADHVTSGSSKAAPKVSRMAGVQRKPHAHGHQEAAEGAPVQRAEKAPDKTDSTKEAPKEKPAKPTEAVQRFLAGEQASERPSGTASFYRKAKEESGQSEMLPPKAAKSNDKDKDKDKDKNKDQGAVQRAEKEPEKPTPQQSPKSKAKPTESKPAEPKPTEPKPAEPKAADSKKTGTEAVQKASAAGNTSSSSMEETASRAIEAKGAGEPLNPSTRNTLESNMGADLSDVRVHDDNSAHEAARGLNARAFTNQNDIWMGQGESQNDTRLMAHEATHVVQQTGGVQRQLVQRAPKTGDKTDSAPAGGWDFEGPEGKVQKGKKMVLPLLRVPEFKKPFTPAPLTLPKKTDEPRPDTQISVWEKDVKSGSGIDSKLNKKIVEEKAPSLQKNGKAVYFFQLKGQDIYVIGSKETIKQRSLRPYWDRSGKAHSFQVDHQLELQLGGSNLETNMWLLDADANMASGRNIRDERNSRIETLLNAAIKKGVWKDPPDVEAVRRGYTIEVEQVAGGLEPTGKPTTWARNEIKDEALQLDPLKALTKKEIDAKGLQGTPTKVVIYTNPTGGGARISDGWKENQTEKAEHFPFGKMFEITKVNFDRNANKGSVEGNVFRGSKLIQEVKLPPIPLQEMDAVDYGGYISVSALTRTIQHELKVRGLSPVEIGEAELTEKGLIARGKIKPSIPPFDKVDVDLIIDGDNIYISKMFSADDFNFPGPIKVTGASLELFAGTQGIGARGDVFFEISRLGKGKISGKASTAEGPSISGDFEFDTDLFDPAKVHVEYSKGKFSGSGDIGIKQGKVRGIKSASVHASVDDGAIDAQGSITPDIPAVEQANLSMHYDEKGGLTIGGDLQLKKDIPGISGGSIHAEVTKKGEKYTVKASGQATPKIPGISSQLNVSYDDGAFDATVTAGYEKGMLKGAVTVGATNRPVGEDGKPAGEPPAKGDKITLYGGGSVTLQLAPWLQATAAIRFLPNGEVEVTGKIGLPSVLNLFEEKKFEKNLLNIGIDIPILGFSVLGQHVGIFLNVGGGLDLSAGIGPGQLQEVELSVTYNPAHEEDTSVHGHAALHIPAHAGLRLNVHAALGAGIPIVSAKAGIELGGTLGLEGALHAAVDVDWSPKKGLVLDAAAEISAEPKFKFDITGFVVVEADLLLKTISLYEKRWQLAAFEYGSGLKLGLKMPVHYEEGKPFNPSLSDIQFEVPSVDPMSVLKGLMDKII